MAFVNSVNYTNEEQFLEAVAKVKAAREIREHALAQQTAETPSLSFQEILQRNYDEQNTSNAFDTAQAPSGARTPVTTTAASNTAVPAAAKTTTSVTGAGAMETYFQKAADTYGIPADLIKAVAKQESNFTSDIVSRSGAVGVMQLMPATAAYLGVTNPYDAEDNIMGGAKLLSQLYSRYNGNIDLTLAAYNAGAGAVDSFGGVPPYSETQNFVAKIKANLGL